jgi:hypothetical protein
MTAELSDPIVEQCKEHQVFKESLSKWTNADWLNQWEAEREVRRNRVRKQWPLLQLPLPVSEVWIGPPGEEGLGP